ncbi:hypothetical protein FA15DRAFT_593507 [Coprinopsis marcescibilis]|uniref:RING-type domain-containing protein n=1 Tax=Coprinopsis marcescibilis TaxID=230819 RepID=A0A5C3KU41_COPMA|nr:hypothetical protein FA15DRAFT_593507 [Coprinopsis marcescibilis]
MFALGPGSSCDVCLKEYGFDRLPQSIQCGHIMCNACCASIIGTTSPHTSPSCPFCRLRFPRDSVRTIVINNEVRRLEDQVAKVAQKKCSIEEVSKLHTAITDCLISAGDHQPASLSLSAALLRAVLVNQMAHSEARKAHESIITQLQSRIAEAEQDSSNLEAEVGRWVSLIMSVQASFLNT